MKARTPWPRLVLPGLVVLAVGGLAALLFGYYDQTSRLMRDEVAGSVMGALSQAETNFRYPLAAVADFSAVLMGNPVLRDILDRSVDPPGPYQQVLDYRQLSAILTAAENDRNIVRVKLYVNPRLSWANEHVNFFGLDSIHKEPWYSAALDREGGMFIQTTWTANYPDKPSLRVLSFIRRIGINAATRPEDFPIMVIDVPETVFGDLLSRLVFSQGERVYLVDRQLRVISAANSADIGSYVGQATRVPVDESILRPCLEGAEGIHDITVAGQRLTVLHRWLADPDWGLVTVIDTGKLLEKTRSFGLVSGVMYLALIIGLILVAALALSAAFNESMVRKIRDISRHIAETGSPGELGSGTRRGDLSRLEGSVASLLETVHTLVEENFQTRERVQEARLVALQAQINPHFLYNTLDSINWMATRQGATDIATVVIALSKYFRMTLNQGKDNVSLREELDMVEAYLVVQKHRFGDIFAVEQEIDPELLDGSLPKLTLQPLVENALLHGIQFRRGGGGLIRISGRRGPAGVELAVSDNGGGMRPEALENLRRSLSGSQPVEGKGYGLTNVQERLRLYFGPGAGLSVDSVPGEGTVATLSYPEKTP